MRRRCQITLRPKPRVSTENQRPRTRNHRMNRKRIAATVVGLALAAGVGLAILFFTTRAPDADACRMRPRRGLNN